MWWISENFDALQMCLLCKQLSHILMLLHKEVVKLVCLCEKYSEICYLYCKRVISIAFKTYICESKWFIVLFHLILETEFLNHEPNNGWLTQIANFRLISQIKSMIIQLNSRHTYGWLSGHLRTYSFWNNHAKFIPSHSRVLFYLYHCVIYIISTVFIHT